MGLEKPGHGPGEPTHRVVARALNSKERAESPIPSDLSALRDLRSAVLALYVVRESGAGEDAPVHVGFEAFFPQGASAKERLFYRARSRDQDATS